MLPFNPCVDYTSNNIEEISIFDSFPNFFGIPPLQINDLIPEDGYNGQINIIPQVIEDIMPNNSNGDNPNGILEAPGVLIEADNPPNDLSNQVFESHSEKIEIIIEKSKSEAKEKILKVNYTKHLSLFDYGKYDDYSERIIQEALNEMSKNKKKTINKKNLFGLKKKRKKRCGFVCRRKQNSDNIRKKIKAKFFKSLKILINEKLKKSGSKLLFNLFPQSIVGNITKKLNKHIFNMILKNVYSKNFNYKTSEKAEVNIKKYKHNLKVLDYLEKNNSISEKSNFNIFKNMKLSKIYKEYLSSKEFGMSISLKKGKENEKYIKDYIIKAHTLLEYFNN